MVKNLPAMQETQLGSPGRKDSLEKGMATGSSILAWRIPWTEEPGGCSLWSRRVRQDPVTNTFTFMFLVYWTVPSVRLVFCEGEHSNVFTWVSLPWPAGVSSTQLVFPRQLCNGKQWPCLGQIRFNMVWLIWLCSQLPDSFPSSLMIQKRCRFFVSTFFINLSRHLKTHTGEWFREGNGPGVSVQQYVI